jgi:hypothetical protein
MWQQNNSKLVFSRKTSSSCTQKKRARREEREEREERQPCIPSSIVLHDEKKILSLYQVPTILLTHEPIRKG